MDDSAVCIKSSYIIGDCLVNILYAYYTCVCVRMYDCSETMMSC